MQELEEQMRLEREAEEARLAAIFEAREAERRARESESLRKKTPLRSLHGRRTCDVRRTR